MSSPPPRPEVIAIHTCAWISASILALMILLQHITELLKHACEFMEQMVNLANHTKQFVLLMQDLLKLLT